MARPKLYRADQPFPLRTLLWLYEFSASLKLAVVLIGGLAAVLAIATFIESNTGTAGARWYVYHTAWFRILLALLALNIFCAAAIRYPWKRYQTGFVVTHLGLLVLLGGSAMTYQGSVNSQMLVYQGQTSNVAVDHDSGYLLVNKLPGRSESLQYPVDFGPFNWADQKPGDFWRRVETALGRDNYPEPWTHPAQLVYEDDKTKIEIVDYYSRSEVRFTPFVQLTFRQAMLDFEIPVELEFDANAHQLGFTQSDFQGLGSVLMWRTTNPHQFRAFTEALPDRTVEGDGVVVIWVGEGEDGETFHLPVAKLQASRDEGKPVPLTEGLAVELVTYAPWADFRRLTTENKLYSQGDDPRIPAVELKLIKQGTEEGAAAEEVQVVRFAQFPFTPGRATMPANVAVEFYHPSLAGRIDILEGPENKLAYRAWQQKLGRVVSAGPLEFDEPVSTWSMGGGQATWQMELTRYVPQDDPETFYKVLPLPFLKDDPQRGTSRRIKVRVTSTAGGETQEKEVWLKQNAPPPWQSPKAQQVEEIKLADGSTLEVSFNVRQTPVGFTMRLDKFDLDVDPGAPMASNYTSYVTIVNENPANGEADEAAGRTRIITMNEPLDKPDPQGRTLRFFQENYLPPGDGMPLGSIFRVNYDPGRWVKYLGSLLVCVGIFIMFYMRAYFFKPASKKMVAAESTEVAKRAADEPAVV